MSGSSTEWITGRWRRTVGVVALSLMALAGSARGDVASRRAIAITLVAPESLDPELGQRITSWFDAARFDVATQLSRRLDRESVLDPQPPGVLLVWVVGGRRQVRLYFSSRPSAQEPPRYLVRTLELERGNDEIAAERTAQVVHLSSLALLEGRARIEADAMAASLAETPPAQANAEVASVARAAPTPGHAARLREHTARAGCPEPPPSRDRSGPAPANRELRWQPSVGYGVSHRFDEGLSHGLRASLGVGTRTFFGGRLTAQAIFPGRQEFDSVELERYGATLALAATAGGTVGRSMQLHGLVGPGMDIVRYAAKRSAQLPNLRPRAPRAELRPLAVLGVLLITRHPRMAITGQVAVALTKTRYEVAVGSGRSVVASGPQVSPILGVELWFQ